MHTSRWGDKVVSCGDVVVGTSPSLRSPQHRLQYIHKSYIYIYIHMYIYIIVPRSLLPALCSHYALCDPDTPLFKNTQTAETMLTDLALSNLVQYKVAFVKREWNSIYVILAYIHIYSLSFSRIAYLLLIRKPSCPWVHSCSWFKAYNCLAPAFSKITCGYAWLQVVCLKHSNWIESCGLFLWKHGIEHIEQVLFLKGASFKRHRF